MRLLQRFIEEYQAQHLEKTQNEQNVLAEIKKVQHLLLQERFSPSNELKKALNRLQKRSEEPMKVAICGQFSSGKSTFLNALLAKDVLPTGITPVTSKVCYIRYGQSFQIKVRYKDGRDAYHAVNAIGTFVDQREQVEEIAYLTLYAPLEILKEVVFVDTPGLNSQSQSDTQATQEVLKEVDGIIWLSLIDNAGKMSELETLKTYLDGYQNKSLCVLNQKDKFTEEQVAQTCAYITQCFGAYFSEVIAISAKEALQSRSHDKRIMQEQLRSHLIEAIEEHVRQQPHRVSMEDVAHFFQTYRLGIEQLNQADASSVDALLASSNITQVLTFINQEIRPQATQAKEYAIARELRHTLKVVQGQYTFLLTIYDELIAQLQAFELEQHKAFDALKQHFSHDLKEAFERIEAIIQTIADALYQEIGVRKRTRYEKAKKSLLHSKEQYVAYTYDAPKINSDLIYKKLFYEDNVIGKMFKQYVKRLNAIQESVNTHNAMVYRDLEERILQWQSTYEQVRKQESLHSDVEFATLRKFASKVYESILKPFHQEMTDSYAKISSEFNHLSSAVSFNYQNATEVCVAFLETKIETSIELFEANPSQFSLYHPKREEIIERLRTSFHLYALENMMAARQTFLSKDYDRLIERFHRLTQEKIQWLATCKATHTEAMKETNRLL